MSPWLWLLMQGLCALATVIVLKRQVLPLVRSLHEPGAALDVWCPLIVALPMITWAFAMPQSVALTGWPTFGAWVVPAAIGVGWSMVPKHSGPNENGRGFRLLAGMLACAAVLTLLLGAAHELTVWVGQAAFATGAVLLWMCTPGHSRNQPTTAEVRVAWGLIAATCLSLGGCIAAVRAGGEWAAICSMISMMAACSVIALAAGSCGRGAAVRIGGWASVYGLFFGVGTLALAHMTRQALMLWSLPPGVTGNGPVPMQVAAGFGAFAPEAVVGLAAVVVLVSSGRAESRWMRPAGLVLLAATLGIVIWRVWRLT